MKFDTSSDFARFELTEEEEIAACCASPYLLPYLKAKLSVYAEASMKNVLESTPGQTDAQRREQFLVDAAKVAVLRELCDEVARTQSAESDRQSQTARSSTQG